MIMNKSLIKSVILALELKRSVEYHEHKRIIRKQLNNKSFKAIGYYTLAYKEKIGQYHRIDYCTKAHDINEVIIHELIHAWQAENLQWTYGHGKDFEIMAEHLAYILGMETEDIISPTYY